MVLPPGMGDHKNLFVDDDGNAHVMDSEGNIKKLELGSSVILWKTILNIGGDTADASTASGWVADNNEHFGIIDIGRHWRWQEDSEIQIGIYNYDANEHTYAGSLRILKVGTTERETCEVNFVTIDPNSFSWLEIGPHDEFDTLLDFTDPLIPTIIEDNEYVISATILRTA